ncbi:MAG: class II fructose-bisphosphate aldolase, partial [Verrucomicrobia bacterium]|nr:class II fructose-bisphosphate aldolase [Verrucomicrobiota bacterium]
PNTHIVMHGSSSVPQDLLAIINKFGGNIKETYGVPVEEIKRGIAAGVRKVNVDTDNRLAMTGAIRKFMMENPADFDLRDYMKEARSAMQKLCEGRMRDFGQAGYASKVPIITLEEMAKRYAAGQYGESAKPRTKFP